MGWGSFVGSIAAPVISAGASIFGANKAASSAREINNRQIDFQTEMSNTAHQREVADLRAAGLNPILSATGGSGASSNSIALQNPGASIAQGYSSAGQSISSGLNSAYQNSKIAEELKQIKADTATKEEAVNLVKEQTKTQMTQQIANSASAKASIANALQAKAAAAKIEQDERINRPSEKVAAAEEDILSDSKGEPGFFSYLKGALNSINPFISTAKSVPAAQTQGGKYVGKHYKH